jgi:hypothetical protein
MFLSAATGPPHSWSGAPRNLLIPEISPLTTLWDAPWCSFGLFGGNDFARDILTHLGPTRSANVGCRNRWLCSPVAIEDELMFHATFAPRSAQMSQRADQAPKSRRGDHASRSTRANRFGTNAEENASAFFVVQSVLIATALA